MQRLIRHPPVWFAAASVALSLLAAPDAALSADPAPVSGDAPRVVNVTADSTPGWLPSEGLEREARKTAVAFMADMDSGRYAEAYAFLAEADRTDQPFAAFSDRLSQFNALAGAVKERRIVTVTWTDNPAHAPFPGVYAALDLVSRFANIDRHCGYLVLYRAPSATSFQVMREEDNFLDNDTAAGIARQSSAAVDSAWAKASANCPGYQSVVNPAALPAPIIPPAPLPEALTSSIGYPTVDAALVSIHAKAGVVFTTQGGWTIADDAAAETIWSFSPPGYPAYPAVVKRQIVQQGGAVSIEMSVLCEASKQPCDDLVRSFQQLNAQVGTVMRSHN